MVASFQPDTPVYCMCFSQPFPVAKSIIRLGSIFGHIKDVSQHPFVVTGKILGRLFQPIGKAGPVTSYKWGELTPMSRVKFHPSYPFIFGHLYTGAPYNIFITPLFFSIGYRGGPPCGHQRMRRQTARQTSRTIIFPFSPAQPGCKD